jgi:hypothetical protein
MTMALRTFSLRLPPTFPWSWCVPAATLSCNGGPAVALLTPTAENVLADVPFASNCVLRVLCAPLGPLATAGVARFSTAHDFSSVRHLIRFRSSFLHDEKCGADAPLSPPRPCANARKDAATFPISLGVIRPGGMNVRLSLSATALGLLCSLVLLWTVRLAVAITGATKDLRALRRRVR